MLIIISACFLIAADFAVYFVVAMSTHGRDVKLRPVHGNAVVSNAETESSKRTVMSKSSSSLLSRFKCQERDDFPFFLCASLSVYVYGFLVLI